MSRFREVAPHRRGEFIAAGYKPSLFFPHRYYYLPKCGPDGFKLAGRMCGPVDPDASWEIVLYAESPHADEFPDHLFFDDDVVWHQQQFGRRGQVATANLVVKGDALYSMVHVSDLVQRIGRRREFKTRVENRFKGWPTLLLNASLNFALEHGLATVYTPTADLALEHTDRRRNPGRELFERIYDRSVASRFRATLHGGWWAIDVAENRARVVAPETKEERSASEKTICLCHDVERGLGHVYDEPSFAPVAEMASRANLARMLAIEEAAGVRATYCVVGSFLAEERARVEAGGHALAFHSYDHVIDSRDGQLSRCRDVDYRLKGYRPPQSRLTPETSAENMLFHNFEWLASSRHSLGFAEPRVSKRLVMIPIAFDDFPLHSERMSYETWEHRALREIEESRFVAFGLHDCYAQYWLHNYADFLEKVKRLGTLKTLDEVAAETTFGNAS
jgi:hypothetical protein